MVGCDARPSDDRILRDAAALPQIMRLWRGSLRVPSNTGTGCDHVAKTHTKTHTKNHVEKSLARGPAWGGRTQQRRRRAEWRGASAPPCAGHRQWEL